MTALPAVLNPEPGDNEDVVSALETADIFWTKGDTDEALRWLKRAAETASDAGNDMRALAIARSAADLKAVPAAAMAAEAPKMSRPPPPSAMARQAPAGASPPSAASGDGARSHAPGAAQKMPPPLPPSKARESGMPPAPSARPATSPPPAPSASAPMAPSRSASTDRMAAVTAEARTVATPARPSTPSPASEAPAARRAAPASSLPKEPHRALTPGTAFRALTVYVKPQGRNGDKLEVILVKPGQAIPAGAEPALLVPTRRGGRLLG